MKSVHAELELQLPAHGALAQGRRLGLLRFKELGLPSKNLEEWYYTSLAPLGNVDFKLAVLDLGTLGHGCDLKFDNSDFYNLIFINGKLDRLLSDWDLLRKEAGLEEISVDESYVVETESAQMTALAALNLSYAQQGLSLRIPQGKKVSRPIQVLNVLTHENLMAHPRFNLQLEAGSECSVIESYVSHSAGCLQNSICEIRQAENSSLKYFRIQSEHLQSFNVGRTVVNLASGAQFRSLVFSTGGAIARHDLAINIQGSEVFASAQGLTLALAGQHIDNNTCIEHRVGGSRTEQLYKAVVGGTAKSVFTGMVRIYKDAQKASSEQLSKSLLLSDKAESNNRPQLQIYADDVKATHGATVGQLDEEEIFYLLSRAIPRAEAIEMLSLGYVRDLVLQVEDMQIQKWLDQILVEAYRL